LRVQPLQVEQKQTRQRLLSGRQQFPAQSVHGHRWQANTIIISFVILLLITALSWGKPTLLENRLTIQLVFLVKLWRILGEIGSFFQ
jgi:hypothetical protein